MEEWTWLRISTPPPRKGMGHLQDLEHDSLEMLHDVWQRRHLNGRDDDFLRHGGDEQRQGSLLLGDACCQSIEVSSETPSSALRWRST